MTAPPTPDGTAGKQSFDQAYRELVDSGRFQTDMPQFEPPEIQQPPGWLESLLRWLEGTGPFWQILFWVVAGALVLLLLWFIGRALYRRFSDRAEIEEDEEEFDWRPEEQTARGLIAEADTLAREGRYAEAVHLLLFRSIADIEERLPDFLKPALTSRDISVSETLPGPARSAFSAIAVIVERGIFAERPVDEGGWNAARSAYEEFAFGRNWARASRA